MQIKASVIEQVSVRHPLLDDVNAISYVMFRDRDPDGAVRTCTTLTPGRVDRSPCGTGTCANLAVLHARGELAVGDDSRSRSIIGGEFGAQIVRETIVGSHNAIVPRITGRGWIYGREFMRIDPNDPFADGFTLSDTWGTGSG